MAMGRSETLYLAGDFTRVSPTAGSRGVVRRGAAAVDVHTGMVTSWNPKPNAGIRKLAVGPSARVVYAVGDFTRIGGQRRAGIAALNPRSGVATAWHPTGLKWGTDVAVARDETRVYVAGNSGVAAIDASSGKLLWKALPRGADALGLSADGAIAFATGLVKSTVRGFSGTEGVIAALRARDGKILWAIPDDEDGIRALLASPDGRTLYVGGAFTEAGEPPRPRHDLAALDARTGHATRWAPNPRGNLAGLDEDRGVYALAFVARVHAVYVGGAFTAIGGAARVGLGAVDAKTGRAMRWNPGTHDTVCALTLSPDSSTLYFGDMCFDPGKVRGVRGARAR
jgi:trimeric autotransporter adhesin